MTGHKGFFYHFLDMKTGHRAGRCELSTVDTALLIGGMLHALVSVLNATGDRHLEPMFAADWRAADDDAARLRVVIDQVASLTDASALAMYERLVGSLPSLW